MLVIDIIYIMQSCMANELITRINIVVELFPIIQPYFN